jgi:hypothetical protein
MSTDIEKALFHLETEEYDKAEKYFSMLYESGNNSPYVISGLIICKIAQSTFDNSYIKAANIYFNKLNNFNLVEEEKEKLIVDIFKQIEKYFLKLNKKFREEANELAKRPALYGQLYSVKQFKDTADYMGYINANIKKYNDGIQFAELLYGLSTNKEETAYKIVLLHDLILQSIKETPSMTGKTLLTAKELTFLLESRNKWLSLSGENKAKLSFNPSDSSGCLVLIVSMSGLIGSILSILWLCFM